ncbi:MAG: class I SAM-dependent methyltransferase [Phycisphaerales bacterium]
MPEKPHKSTVRTPPLSARADRHELYQCAVQTPDAEIDFVDDTFKSLRRRRATVLREDFCGTAFTSCEWVRRRPGNIAFGVDLDRPTLDWGAEHNLAKLKPAARARLTLVESDVLEVKTRRAPEIVLAMNFSYFLFKQRDLLRRYFAKVRADLSEDGVFMLDAYGGSDAFRELREKRLVKKGPRGIGRFTYIWQQAKYDPITGEQLCHIHFQLRDGSKIRKAFSYDWRLWTLPELREILAEAGFARTTVYWEGTDPKTNEGNGDFQPAEHGEADLGWICYLVAER